MRKCCFAARYRNAHGDQRDADVRATKAHQARIAQASAGGASDTNDSADDDDALFVFLFERRRRAGGRPVWPIRDGRAATAAGKLAAAKVLSERAARATTTTTIARKCDVVT